MSIHNDAEIIIKESISAVLPDAAVEKALAQLPHTQGRLILVAIGKAAWQMANAAYINLGDKIDSGIVITKHDHSQGAIGNLVIREAGHPVPDKDSYSATAEAIDMVSNLSANDQVLFLISGGGSALFEKPLVDESEMDSITHQLLACGADIVEINTIRKRLSAVKGGRFAKICEPAKVFSIILSDVLGDPLDMIASGPAYPDSSTTSQALGIVDKYKLQLSEHAMNMLKTDTPKVLNNVQTIITGSVSQLCEAAAQTCMKLGYKPIILTDRLTCEARAAGNMLGSIALTNAVHGNTHSDPIQHNAMQYIAMQLDTSTQTSESLAFIAGGETVVHLTGQGKGGRNQEIALSAAQVIDGLEDVVIFSVGSDGTDGPTDAAGGIVDGTTAEKLRALDISIDEVLKNNDAYTALAKVNGLIMTGPTGTNVNDVAVVLIKK